MSRRHARAEDSEDGSDGETEEHEERLVRTDGDELYFHAQIKRPSTLAFVMSLNRLASKLRARSLRSQRKHRKVEEPVQEPPAADAEVPPQLRLTVHVMSTGGDLDGGFALYDAMRALRDVHKTVVVDGNCCSAAVLLLLAADRRLMRANAYLMLHDTMLSGFREGTPMHTMRLDLRHFRRLDLRYNRIVARHTRLSVGNLRRMTRVHELWLSAPQALELGFVDEIC